MSKPRQDVWRNPERYYCAVCNAWMASDRQSILVHENGKKHKQNVEKALEQKRTDKLREEKDQNALQKTLQKMEQTAMQSLMGQDSHMYAQHLTATSNHEVRSINQTPPPPPPPNHVIPKGASKKQEKKQWQAQKKRLQEERESRRRQDGKESDEEESHDTTKHSTGRRTIGPEEGHYTIDNKTYLEGPTFGGILEEELPVQIWTGSVLASAEEKRLPERNVYWIHGLVVALSTTRKRHLPGEDDPEVLVDVAYLKSDSDTEETLEKSVPLHRIRMVLGGSTNKDEPRLPETLEEARVLALGGEEIMEATSSTNVVDENTGFTSWSTVSIRRTTVSQELKEERQRKREEEQAAKRKQAQKDRELEARRMEEAKVENADDSALGAFDVWSQSAKTGYKGVDISKEVQLSVQDTAKKLVKAGGKVAFKKKVKKKQSRRVTSADDD